MINQILLLVLLTLIPFLELRYSIPAGILAGSVKLPFGLALVGLNMPWYIVFLVCVITNFILGIIIFLLLRTIVNYMRKFKWFEKIYKKIITRPQRRIKKYVDKYGELGVGLFIAIRSLCSRFKIQKIYNCRFNWSYNRRNHSNNFIFKQ